MHDLLQCLAVQKFHRDEPTVAIFPDVIHRRDVGVVQCRRGAGLALEAVADVWIACEVVRQELECYKAAKTSVLAKLGLVDYTRPAFAEHVPDK